MSLPSSDAAERFIEGKEGGALAVLVSTFGRALIIYSGTRIFGGGASWKASMGGAVMIECFVLLIAYNDHNEGKG